MVYTKTFADIAPNDREAAGGKGASLADMVQAGFNVPEGYVVLTGSYEQFLQKSGIEPEISSLLSSVDTDEMHTIESASASITQLILSAVIPEEIISSINKAFNRLDAGYVAVRSSATAEDGLQAAWAGQLDTFLNTDEENLIPAVRKCWASLFTPRAIFYRMQKELRDKPVSVAVVVQKMIQSDTSGIAFSVHPVTEDPNQMIIEAGFGLGESIVSGEVTPDNYVVQKKPLKIISKSTHSQQKGLYRSADGGSEYKAVSVSKAGTQALSDADILELSELVKRVEAHYGFPCDIEWAKKNSKLYLLQCRPITTLRTPKNPQLLSEEFLKQNDGEKIIRIEGDFVPFQLMVEWWNYYDVKHEWGGLYPVLFFFTPKRTVFFLSHEKYGGISAEVFSNLIDGKGSIKDFQEGYEKYKSRITEKYKHYFMNDNNLDIEADIVQEFKSVYDDFQQIVAWTQFYEQLDEAAVNSVLKDKDVDLNKIWEMVHLPSFTSFDTRKKEYILKALNGEVTPRYVCFAFSDYTFSADEKFVRGELKKTDFDKLADQINSAKELTEKAKDKLKKYFDETDDLTRLCIEILRWTLFCRDERKHVINQTELLLLHFSSKLFDIWGIDKKHLRYVGASEILLGREYIGSIKEDLPTRKQGFSVLYRTDRTALIGYDQLEKQISELDQALLAQHRQSDSGKINGEIANRGRIVGKVRIVRRRDEFGGFKKGEILVTGMTRPEFVPLMEKAAGIITDEGGITSHAAIVSRELDKPCIIGTKVATQMLKTGDRVLLDADTGTVRVID